MNYFVETLLEMALPDADPFAKFMCEHYAFAPRVDRDVTVPSSMVINVRPDVHASDIPSSINYHMAGTNHSVSRYVIAVQLDGILRTPKGTSVFTIYRLVNRKDARFVLVQNDADEIIYHVSANGECRVCTHNQAGDPIHYIVVHTDNGMYQLAEFVNLDSRQPIERDRMAEVEMRYPLTTFDPDYKDTF